MSSGHLINVQTEESDSSLVIVVTGELDMASASDLADALHDADWDSYDKVVIDLLGISFIDSSGLGALIALRNEHPDNELVLVAADEGLVTKVLELTAMKDLFRIYSSTEAALT